MTLIDLDVPSKSERMSKRQVTESGPNSDLGVSITIEPVKEKPCFSSTKLVPRTSEERRKIFELHLKERRERNTKKKIITETFNTSKKEKDQFKDQSQLIVMQLRKNLKKLRYDPSLIHQWGVYTTEPIKKHEAVIEYIGELIRLRVVEKRQITYEAEGNNGSYIFQLEKDKFIDATHRGGLARFINHSCSPNCATQAVQFEGKNHIIIYAKRDILAYEELCYDYKMEYETKDKRIPCLCGSPSCKHWLNWSEKAESELTYKYHGTTPQRSFKNASTDREPDSSSESNESPEVAKPNESLNLNEEKEQDRSSESIESADVSDETVDLNDSALYDDSNVFYDDQVSDADKSSDSEDFYAPPKKNKSKKQPTSRKSNKVKQVPFLNPQLAINKNQISNAQQPLTSMPKSPPFILQSKQFTNEQWETVQKLLVMKNSMPALFQKLINSQKTAVQVNHFTQKPIPQQMQSQANITPNPVIALDPSNLVNHPKPPSIPQESNTQNLQSVEHQTIPQKTQDQAKMLSISNLIHHDPKELNSNQTVPTHSSQDYKPNDNANQDNQN
ncbi:hypothetical protein M9Y10_038894 [Tritrichomonas musculus]|uniref:[histone H3]-lysine(4) N-trimethyltransferase n=1 Tax=Tritrichomonas musculus TaxID=1915356 RepID=A0ABR2KBI6_9EUKA